MNRFFLDSQLFTDEGVKFPEDIAHQILNVLRLTSNDEVEVLDGCGFLFRVALDVDQNKKNIYGQIISKELVKTEPVTRITLCFGLTSREKVEWILQKGTEIGVAMFSPFISKRTLIQTTELSEKKSKRWERIIKEAAEQSHRGQLAKLESPKNLEKCLTESNQNHMLSLIAWEGESKEQANLKRSLQGFDGTSIALFVGPEGGFSREEISKAKNAGCQVISMGARILRMETAAILLPALILYELGEI